MGTDSLMETTNETADFGTSAFFYEHELTFCTPTAVKQGIMKVISTCTAADRLHTKEMQNGTKVINNSTIFTKQ